MDVSQRRPSIAHATAQQPEARGQCFESLGRHLMGDFSVMRPFVLQPQLRGCLGLMCCWMPLSCS